MVSIKDILRIEYPEFINTPRSKVAYWFFRRYYTLNLGKGKVLGRATDWTTEAGVFLLVLDRWFVSVSITFIIILFLSVLVISFLLGLLYEKYQLDRIESVIQIERNEMYRRLYGSIKNNDKEGML